MSESVSPAGGHGDATTNHETIRRWAEQRNANPARASANGDGALRFSFPEMDRFTVVPWREFFATFEREGLAFVYQPEEDPGVDSSRFYKFVDRATV
ncbi:hypothetical protein [Halorubellus sp. PRR65]|uniref:hypothetical protein n=1 Tax=Halorubellus sp. PRR65 TaxID=3098148 RepID=UPI002B261588|nr:hypothetical protein [Halorubellus sp. PRR65]